MAQTTAESMQATIRHADAKAATLLGFTGSIAVVTADHTSSMLTVPGHTALVPLLVLLAGSLAKTTWHLLLATRPRLTRPEGDNRFAFPDACGTTHRTDRRRGQRDEAWKLVAVLAHIAVTKYREIQRAVPWLVVALMAAGFLSIALTAWNH